jgi:hypothetical protein
MLKTIFHFVLHWLRIFAAFENLVGQAPWPAADPLVGLFGPGTDWLRLCCSVGQAILPAAAFQAALGCDYAALWGRAMPCPDVRAKDFFGISLINLPS